MPSEHNGVAVTGIKRRGSVSYVQQRRDTELQERLAAEAEAEAAQVEVGVLMREWDAARAELDTEQAVAVPDLFSVPLDVFPESAKPKPRLGLAI